MSTLEEGATGEAQAAAERMKAIDPTAEPRSGSGPKASGKSGDLIFLDLNDTPKAKEMRRSIAMKRATQGLKIIELDDEPPRPKAKPTPPPAAPVKAPPPEAVKPPPPPPVPVKPAPKPEPPPRPSRTDGLVFLDRLDGSLLASRAPFSDDAAQKRP